MLRIILALSFCVVLVENHPTMYRMNDNKVLEPDLIPVSSTVIPLPVYKVSFGINVLSAKDEKLKRPEGPIELETVYTKKKPIPQPKTKPLSDVSSVKQVSEKQYQS
ncbi:unnamed protein product [Psylliodes chrysocephalus]|uniref:Uncharacterized protein n=1 Tax=Psylliodes chrysocephalus TaxID=3402493 RepID=A0A9P0D6B3_9CUCU|nr:unnamed protein product [Psylliodes chrysocephala]